MEKILKFFLTIAIVFVVTSLGFAQTNISVNEATIVTRMMYHVKEQNQISPYTKGWRIQVLSTTDRQKLETAKAEFQEKFPGVLVDWEHSKPYYKLQAGAFTSKLEATYLLHQLKREFPSAYPIKDNAIPSRQLLNVYY